MPQKALPKSRVFWIGRDGYEGYDSLYAYQREPHWEDELLEWRCDPNNMSGIEMCPEGFKAVAGRTFLRRGQKAQFRLVQVSPAVGHE